MNLSPERKFTEQEKSARAQLNYALSQYMQGNKSGALKALRQALTLDPALAQEKVALNLVQELTGMPAQEALKSLVNASESKDLIKTARKQEQKEQKAAPAQSPGVTVYLLVGLLIVLAGMVAWGAISGGFDNAFARLQAFQYASQKYNSAGYDYYMIAPSGKMPDAGWNVVVAFHGYGGDGASMLPFAKTFTDAGAIFVAPTFGAYQPNPGNGPIEPMSQILRDVAAKYPIQSRGAVLLGLSQGGMFAYRFSVYHSEQVYGVVTAGSPGFDPIIPARNMPYIFSWGEKDGLQDFVVPKDVQPIKNAGYNVGVYVIAGYGHEMTPFAIEQALNMIR